jgi:uncharacterized membrane protein
MKILVNKKMKNLIHTIASLCMLIWLIGFFNYDLSGQFHFFFFIALAAAITRLAMEKQFNRKHK